MQFSKPMIDLVYEIRRLAPSDLKPSVKLANPELFDELKIYYFDKATTISKALIKELFSLAGPEWLQLLQNPEGLGKKQHVKIYRGQTILEEKKKNVPMSEEQLKKMRKKIYRGQVVHT